MQELIVMISWVLKVVGLVLILFVTPLSFLSFGLAGEVVGVPGSPPSWVGAVVPIGLGGVLFWLGLRLRRKY